MTMTEDRLAGMESKLDALALAVAGLAAEIGADHRASAVTELRREMAPVLEEAVAAATDHLDELDRRGYFAFARGSGRVIDKVVTAFGEDDLAQLGDNIVLILQTVREMTQPEVMAMLGRVAHIAHEEEAADVSVRSLLHQLRDPRVKRGLHRVLNMLAGMAETTPPPAVTTDDH